MSLHIIILAAGKGTRMRSNIPKVLHQLGGKPLLEHVIKTAQKLNPDKIHIVYGDGGDLVRSRLEHYEVNWVEQAKQLGTGHAVMQALPHVEDDAQVLILYGDVPLTAAATLEQLTSDIPSQGLNLLTAKLIDPTGFGRIIRNDCGMIIKIIEHKDASPLQQEINEINTGIMATSALVLQNYLSRLNQHNAQGEYYLTDIIEILANAALPINGVIAVNHEEIMGVNDNKQLAYLERYYQKSLANELMLQGLTLLDPNRFDLRGDLTISSDVTIDVNVVITGKVSIGANSYIGANSCLTNVQIGKNVQINPNSIITDAIIEDGCIIGPFARIRPGTHLYTNVHVGNFVEVKNSKVGKGSKANHLTYLGDTTVGENVNVGAGTITANYDGVNKHPTQIADGASIGSNAVLVAPVTIGKNATIGAGSVITTNAPAEKLTVARARQIVIENWERPKRHQT